MTPCEAPGETRRIAEEIERIANFIRGQHRRQMLAAVRSLWRVGDAVRRLREIAPEGQWGRAVEICAGRVGMHAASLDEAARAAQAFGVAERRSLLQRFESAATDLSPSHVIELARLPRNRRLEAIDRLLREPHTVREFRSYLRGDVL